MLSRDAKKGRNELLASNVMPFYMCAPGHHYDVSLNNHREKPTNNKVNFTGIKKPMVQTYTEYNKCVCVHVFPGVIEERMNAFVYKTTCTCACVCVEAERRELVVQWLVDLASITWEEEEVPDDWVKQLTVPMHKKGSSKVCGNYRGIALLSVPRKVFCHVIEMRVAERAEEVLRTEQCGFCKG